MNIEEDERIKKILRQAEKLRKDPDTQPRLVKMNNFYLRNNVGAFKGICNGKFFSDRLNEFSGSKKDFAYAVSLAMGQITKREIALE